MRGLAGSLALLLISLSVSGCEIIDAMRASSRATDPGTQTYEEILLWFGENEVAPFPEGTAVTEDAAECSGVNEASAISPFVLWPEPLIRALQTTGAKPWALVEFDVTQAGLAENVRIRASSAPPSFERRAIESVQNWTFKPAPSGARASGCVTVFR
jgi:TonB family protein